MKVTEKLYMDLAGPEEHGPVTIVALGDSMPHGFVAAGETEEETAFREIWEEISKRQAPLALASFVIAFSALRE